MPALRRLALILAIPGLASCTAADDPAPSPSVCERTLDELVAERVPDAAPPLGVAPRVYADDTLDAPGRVVDPDPLVRGEKPVRRYWLPPGECELTGGAYGWAPAAPPLEGEVPAPDSELGLLDDPTGSIRALVVTGPDPGAAADQAAWSAALQALGARGAGLHAPSRDALLGAIDDLCGGLSGADVRGLVTVLLVTAGRGTGSGGGALLLPDDEAVRWTVLAQRLRDRCGDAGLVVWVADASHTLSLGEIAQPSVPWVLWRASDAAVPRPPRVSPHGGGALSAGLAQVVAQRARDRCLAALQTTPGDLAALWDPAGIEPLVQAAIAAQRWRSVGVPALALSDAPGARERIVSALEAQVPAQLGAVLGALPLPERCAQDFHCSNYAPGCGYGACTGFACVEGACVPDALAAEGDPCDDANDCTEDDRCRAGGRCAGDVIECDDGNPCTVEGCVFGEGCVAVERDPGSECEDGDLCTEGDACEDGTCLGQPVECADDDPCTRDECEPALGCVFEVDDLACDDGDLCTEFDVCKKGVCGGSAKLCVDGNPCTVDACGALTGACTFPPKNDAVLCDDGDLCTDLDHCEQGECVGTPKTCDDGDECTLDLCQDALCQHLSKPGFCATGDACVPVGASPPGEPCLLCDKTGVLSADPDLEGAGCPDDGIPCTLDVCQGGVCAHPNAPGTCKTPGGGCVGVGELLTPCLVCADTGVGSPAAQGAACDDGDPCTSGDSCDAAGVCSGDPLGCCPAAPELTCGGVVAGDTGAEGVPNVVDVWQCLSSTNFPGPEIAHPFVAECDGLVTFELQSEGGGKLLFLVRGDLDACGNEECSTFTGGAITQPVTEGEPITLVVDGSPFVAGPYTLSAECTCNP